MNTEKTIPLERILSKMGVLSRNKTRLLINQGRVKVNSVVIKKHFHPVHPETDVIMVDNVVMKAAEPVYIMLNKNPGYITSTLDDKSREGIFAELPDEITHLFPVFRLDNDAEGMMLFTNDTAWSKKLTENAALIPMTYTVQVMESFPDGIIEEMRTGVNDIGDILRLDDVSIIKASSKTSLIKVVLAGDDYSLIRRIFGFFELHILHLVRTEIGRLKLGDLEKGQIRLLDSAESILVIPE